VRQYRRVLLALGFALLLSGWAVESAADTPENTREKTPEQRRAELLKQGADALRRGQPLEALARWRAAWDIRHHYEIACDIGTAEFLYGSSREAATFLSICVREHPATSPRERARLDEAQENLAKAREQVGRLLIAVSRGGAEVRVDGRSVGLSPLEEIFVDPGVHRVSADLPGYTRGEAVVDVPKGAERFVAICLEKLPSSQGALPCPLASAARTFTGADPEGRPHPGGGASVPLAIGGSALSGAIAGLGIGLAVASNSAETQRDSHSAEMARRSNIDCSRTDTNPACVGYVSHEQSRLDLTRGATASFIVAGAVAAATAIYIVYPRSISRPALQQSGTMMMVHQW
jgi:hypothetical protein